MAAFICSNCESVVEVDGMETVQCPSCGCTLRNNSASTRTNPHLVSTVLQVIDAPPRTIGRYLVESKLGSGGFGSVYLARDPQLDRPVAIKVPRRESANDATFLERFAREGRSAAQLRHAGIVSVYNVEQDGEYPFIICEYIEGTSLHDRLKHETFAFVEAAKIVAAVACAVHYAHSRGIIHRDIKPANILIGTDGQPRLADFGLAKRETDDDCLTADDRVLGTPAYMSPEQAWGKRAGIDKRTDIYSLGTVLYQLLTHELPFRGEPRMVRRQVIDEDPRNPRSLNSDIPADLETICQKAMEKEPAKRYQTAGDLAADIEHWLHREPIRARPVGRPERAWRWCRRNPLTAGLVASIALLLSTIACGATLLYAGEHKARTEVEQLLSDNRELLSKSYVERASRHLRPDGAMEAYSPIKALPWFQAAMVIDENNPFRRDASRLRVGAALRSAPAVEKLWSHGGAVQVAALSPLKDRFFTGGVDGTGRLWEVAKEEASKPDLIHPASVSSAEFSPDGKLLLTGCRDGAARLWDVSSGKLWSGPFRDEEWIKQQPKLGSAPGHDFRARFSATGRFFVTIRGRAARVWDTASGKPVGKLFFSRSPRIVSAEFIRDESTLLIAGSDGSMSAVDVASGKERYRLGQSSINVVPAPAITRDAKLVAGVRGTKSVMLWSSDSGKPLALPELVHESTVTALSFADDGRSLATGTKDGTIFLWSTNAGKQIWKRRVSFGEIRNIEAGGSGKPLVVNTIGVNGAYVLDSDSGNLVAEPIIAPSPIQLVKTLAEPGLLAVATYDGMIRCWRFDGGEPAILLPHSHRVCAAAVSGDRRVVATIDKADVCCLVASRENQSFEISNARTFAPGLGEALDAALSADGSKLAIADRGSNLATFETSKAPRLLARMETGQLVVRIAFSSNGRHLVTFSQNGQAAVWDSQSGERTRQEQFDASRDGRLIDVQKNGDLWLIGTNNHFVVWDPLTGMRRGPQVTQESFFVSCRLTSDGRFALTASNDQMARIWDVASGKLVASTPKLSSPVLSVEFSPDGKRFATGGVDGLGRVWRTSDAQPVTGALMHAQPITGLHFSPDGRWLVTSSLDSGDNANVDTVIRAWDALTGECVFVRSVARFAARYPPAPDRIVADPWGVAALFFSADARRVHLISRGGVLATYDMSPDNRPGRELLDEVAVRSGTQPDSNGDLLLLDPDRLMAIWHSLRPRP